MLAILFCFIQEYHEHRRLPILIKDGNEFTEEAIIRTINKILMLEAVSVSFEDRIKFIFVLNIILKLIKLIEKDDVEEWMKSYRSIHLYFTIQSRGKVPLLRSDYISVNS